MTALAGSDVEVIEHLDFDESKACEWTTSQEPEKCGAEAVALVVHTCCGASWLICAPHIEESKRRMGVARKQRVVLECRHCGSRAVDLEFLPLSMGGGS